MLKTIIWAFLWASTCYISFNIGIVVTASSVARVLKQPVKIDFTVHFIFAVIVFLVCLFILVALG